jgi:hypothetical protein
MKENKDKETNQVRRIRLTTYILLNLVASKGVARNYYWEALPFVPPFSYAIETTNRRV